MRPIPEARRARERRLGDAGERGRGGASAYLGGERGGARATASAVARPRAETPSHARRKPKRADDLGAPVVSFQQCEAPRATTRARVKSMTTHEHMKQSSSEPCCVFSITRLSRRRSKAVGFVFAIVSPPLARDDPLRPSVSSSTSPHPSPPAGTARRGCSRTPGTPPRAPPLPSPPRPPFSASFPAFPRRPSRLPARGASSPRRVAPPLLR